MNPVGRPKMYTTEEARLAANAKRARDRYISKKRTTPNRGDHPAYGIFCNAKKRARDQGVPFSIELEDIHIPAVCPLLQIPLYKGEGVYTDNSPTLDKVIPSLGYAKGNIQVVSMRANRIKNDSTFKEFEMIYLVWKNQREIL